MSVRSFSSALLLGILAGLPIVATSTAQSNLAVARLSDNNRSGHAASTTSENRGRIAADYGKLSISFEANRGQTDKRVSFVACAAGMVFI